MGLAVDKSVSLVLREYTKEEVDAARQMCWKAASDDDEARIFLDMLGLA